MSNPYEAPENRNEAQPKRKRTGIWLMFVFLLMLGGCAMVSLLFVSTSVTTTNTPVTAQPVPVDAPAE